MRKAFFSISIVGFALGALGALGAWAEVTPNEVIGRFQAKASSFCSGQARFRTCFTIDQKTCESRVRGALEACGRDQKLRFLSHRNLKAEEVVELEDNLSSCLTKNYEQAGVSSFKPSPKCPKRSWEEKAELKRQTPVEAPVSVSATYIARIQADIQAGQKLKFALANGSACPGRQGQGASDCFRQVLERLEIKSSTELILMQVLAVSAALKDFESKKTDVLGLVDLVLAVSERAHLAQFHLARMSPTDDEGLYELKKLRSEDEKMLITQREKMYNLLNSKLSELTKQGRRPAGLSGLKMRLEAMRSRSWQYPE